MFVKITKKNIDKLHEGAILVRYPLSGDSARIDITDPKKFQTFQVDRLWRTSLDLIAAPDNARTEFAHNAIRGHSVNKKQSEITNDDKWWLLEESLYR